VTILQVPSIAKGGSKRVKLEKLRAHAKDGIHFGAIGIEAIVALRRAGIEPQYIYGVGEAAVESAQCGLPIIIACSDDAMPGLLKRLQEENLIYEIIELAP
jgi:putative transcriptional regulator